MSAVADVLNGAADLLEREGWCQGQYRNVDGRRCLARALADALDLPLNGPANWHHNPLYDAAALALKQVTGRHFIAMWNDEPGRTQAEVVAALRAAAEQAA